MIVSLPGAGMMSKMGRCVVLLVLLLIIKLGHAMVLDDEATIFRSNSLPNDRKFMATVGNGYVATTVYSDTIFMNGLFNGEGGASHRARIPATVSVTVSLDGSTNQSYALDVARGVFTHTLQSEVANVQQRTYAHQFYSRLLVTEITVDRTNAIATREPQPIRVDLKSNMGGPSDDVEFHDGPDFQGGKYMLGKIKTPELKGGDKPIVHVVWTPVPDNITLPADQSTQTWTFITSISSNQKEAQQFYHNGMNLAGKGRLYSNHTQSWLNVWEEGRIETTGNLKLQQAIYGSLYYILSSLPPLNAPKDFEFFGVSPGGLANGKYQADYQGHIFWDQATWMYPPILLLHPELARSMLESRTRVLDAAKDNARKRGYNGAMFPWESAYTGHEVCPAPGPLKYEHHVTGDIAFAAQQYFLSTEDVDFLLYQKGYDFITSMAQFWASRTQYDKDKKKYVIKAVMPPDEYHENVDNSAYTNIVAMYSINFASKLAKLLGKTTPSNWTDIVNNMYVPFDQKLQYHPEYEGYTTNIQIKQADVILLGYPLLYNMSEQVYRNDLTIYERVTDVKGPAMTWGIFATGWLQLGNITKANSLFARNYKNIQEPFKVWTETSFGAGAVNFMTGMGGFLQAVMNGYGGIRLRENQLDYHPTIPEHTTNFNIIGLDYRRNKLNFEADCNQIRVTLTRQDKGHQQLRLKVKATGQEHILQPGVSVVFSRGAASIFPQTTL
ncbi:PREDICTED: acid trehalase-like protein 1 [Branchiostoma belcheri]|uniref:Protein-glucosylgalactosylhydroxylysine glucosidase n=1 Tax=Branchiostoma belcheri TaxID=7741 RepID=A0A6P4XKY2_BRABE|nr:PREDICTED: acid trehalase-like protein 1 [Branchiostoma belcheri]